jgi:hypothetical protein
MVICLMSMWRTWSNSGLPRWSHLDVSREQQHLELLQRTYVESEDEQWAASITAGRFSMGAMVVCFLAGKQTD